jgi:formyl-CoA transferase/CoA:oxalate CoA-transferase
MLLDVTHRTEGNMKVVGFPIKFSDTPSKMRLAPPLLGEHNDDILSDYLAFSVEEIENLKKAGAI